MTVKIQKAVFNDISPVSGCNIKLQNNPVTGAWPRGHYFTTTQLPRGQRGEWPLVICHKWLIQLRTTLYRDGRDILALSKHWHLIDNYLRISIHTSESIGTSPAYIYTPIVYNSDTIIKSIEMEPLFVDTNLEYEMDMSLFPGWNDDFWRSQPKLLVHSYGICYCDPDEDNCSTEGSCCLINPFDIIG